MEIIYRRMERVYGQTGSADRRMDRIYEQTGSADGWMERIYRQTGSASWVDRRQISIDTYSIYSDTYGVMDASF